MIGLTKWMFLGEFVGMVTVDTLNITPEMLRLVAQIDEFKGAWKALGTLAPERLTALRRVATIESVGSSTRIEGSKRSDREVESLLAKRSIHTFATRDEQRGNHGAGFPVMGAYPFDRKSYPSASPGLAPLQRQRRAPPESV